MSPTTKKKPQWRENLSLKLISLILAVMLELYFYSPDNSLTVALPVTIDVKNVPESLMFISPKNGDKGIPARFAVRGPRPLIEQVRAVTHHYVIDYPPDHPLLFSTALDPRQLSMPAGVEVLEMQPRAVTVELERVQQKQLPVEFDGGGTVAPGYQLDKIEVTPDTATITGPESEIQPLKRLRTERFSVDGLTESRHLDVPIVNPGVFSRTDIQTVKVEVHVSAIPAEKSFEKVNVKVMAPYGFAGTVEPSRVKCVLSGTKENLEKLEAGAIELQADGRDLREGRHEVEPRAVLPDGVKLLSVEPKTVTVHLVKQ